MHIVRKLQSGCQSIREIWGGLRIVEALVHVIVRKWQGWRKEGVFFHEIVVIGEACQ